MANALVVRKDRVLQSQQMHRAAQYVRMSTDHQQYSIENQAAVIATYAELHKLAIVRTYRDEGESGLKIENRPGLIQLIDDVRSGQTDFGHLLVLDVSRWGRFQDIDESAHYEFICRKAGIKVAYCAEQFDNDGSLLSSIVKNIKRVMAAEFSRELLAKVHRGASRLASLGFKMGGPAAYGLQRFVVDERTHAKGFLKRGERKFLITDRVKLCPGAPDQIEVVKWIFQRYLRDKSQASIARELNRRGIPTDLGGQWRPHMIGRLLSNEAYVGASVYNRVAEKLGAKRTLNPKDLWIRSEGAIEPLIERDVFRRVKEIREERRVEIPEQEMLVRLRKVLAKRGKLSRTIIDATPGLPCVSAYLVHFGTLRNAYRLIGYTKQAYWDKLAAHKRWVSLHLGNAAYLRDAFEKAGKCAVLDASLECLKIDNAVNICFRVAKWRKRDTRSLRWTLGRRVRWQKGWVVILRLGERNETILDYLLMPSSSFSGRPFWFTEHTRTRHRIERFETLAELSQSLVKRGCKITRDTSTLPTKGASRSKKGKDRRL
jgi:DNA invertase Pin-like site-specific DNA recombinase